MTEIIKQSGDPSPEEPQPEEEEEEEEEETLGQKGKKEAVPKKKRKTH